MQMCRSEECGHIPSWEAATLEETWASQQATRSACNWGLLLEGLVLLSARKEGMLNLWDVLVTPDSRQQVVWASWFPWVAFAGSGGREILLLGRIQSRLSELLGEMPNGPVYSSKGAKGHEATNSVDRRMIVCEPTSSLLNGCSVTESSSVCHTKVPEDLNAKNQS